MTSREEVKGRVNGGRGANEEEIINGDDSESRIDRTRIWVRWVRWVRYEP